MSKVKLSKSQYSKGLNCTKALWLHKNKNLWLQKEKQNSSGSISVQQFTFDQGHEVGELATKNFPGGILIEESHFQLDKALIKTQEIVAKNPPAIFEGTFEYDDVLVRVDILENNGDGTWNLIEVKSSTKVNLETHIDDVAIQLWVIQNFGLKIKNVFIMHLNRDYVRMGDLDISKLFIKTNVQEEVKKRIVEVSGAVNNLKKIVSEGEPPNVAIGSHCKNPYVCEYKNHCWKDIGEGSIHLLGRITDKMRAQLTKDGISLVSEIPDNVKLTTNQQVERLAAISNKPMIDSQLIQEHLDNLSYPLYFLDYESVSYAIPRYDNSWPYKQLVTQYSLHVVEKPGATPKHFEFIFDQNADPNQAFADSIVQNIKDDGGSIIVYHLDFERSRTREVADDVANHSEYLRELADRMWDLEVPFAKRWYWDASFEGSSSIKNVLPFFAPNFSYEDLSIQKGDTAQVKYSQMVALPASSKEKEEIKNALLRYCERDSFAMVIILNELINIVDEKLSKKVV